MQRRATSTNIRSKLVWHDVTWIIQVLVSVFSYNLKNKRWISLKNLWKYPGFAHLKRKEGMPNIDTFSSNFFNLFNSTSQSSLKSLTSWPKWKYALNTNRICETAKKWLHPKRIQTSKLLWCAGYTEKTTRIKHNQNDDWNGMWNKYVAVM